MGRGQREADQSEVGERAEGDDGDLPTWYRFACSTRKAAAGWSTGFVAVAGGRPWFPMPSEPWHELAILSLVSCEFHA